MSLYPLAIFFALAASGSTARATTVLPGHPDPRSTREVALALISRDDESSLNRAVTLLDQALQANAGLYQARADRALAEFLIAAADRDEEASSENAPAPRVSWRSRREQALESLRPLVREHAFDPSVARALAVYYGLDANVEQTAKFAAQTRAAGRSDGFIDLAELLAQLPTDPGEVALARLAAFSVAHPQLLRARLMLARAQLALSRKSEALSTLDGLLAANPRYERAQRLKAFILSPPPSRVIPVPAWRDGPLPHPGGRLPRKRSTAVKAIPPF
ncbi:MAG TPA: tetratricopeptide repeat protein [Anaeromyxobacteraceae bacterium]|nr:tetratricopeptide repeat protein [Anaeromyxobacteraceae bacterium]